jgi:hypothetical protein
MKDGKLVRTTPNPEKKQIAKVDKQKMLVTELDRLSKIYPYSSPTELKVKSMVNYLTQGLDIDQIIKLEYFTQLMIERKINAEEFKRALFREYQQGGVGITAAVATVMANKVSQILKQSEDIRRFRRRFMSNNFFSRENTWIKRLTYYLIKAYDGELIPTQRKRIAELIANRVSGLIRKEEFQDSLSSPLESGGVDLTENAAFKLTLYFEKIMTQGTDIEIVK